LPSGITSRTCGNRMNPISGMCCIEFPFLPNTVSATLMKVAASFLAFV
jgi:hypothetical protein